MEPLALLARCRDAGLVVTPDGTDGLHVRGPKAAEALVVELRAHKADIRRLLTSVWIEPVEDAERTTYRLVRGDGEPLHLGLCVSNQWARALAAEHGLTVCEEAAR